MARLFALIAVCAAEPQSITALLNTDGDKDDVIVRADADAVDDNKATNARAAMIFAEEDTALAAVVLGNSGNITAPSCLLDMESGDSDDDTIVSCLADTLKAVFAEGAADTGYFGALWITDIISNPGDNCTKASDSKQWTLTDLNKSDDDSDDKSDNSTDDRRRLDDNDDDGWSPITTSNNDTASVSLQDGDNKATVAFKFNITQLLIEAIDISGSSDVCANAVFAWANGKDGLNAKDLSIENVAFTPAPDANPLASFGGALKGVKSALPEGIVVQSYAGIITGKKDARRSLRA